MPVTHLPRSTNNSERFRNRQHQRFLEQLAGGDDARDQARLLGLGGVHEARRQAQAHRLGLGHRSHRRLDAFPVASDEVGPATKSWSLPDGTTSDSSVKKRGPLLPVLLDSILISRINYPQTRSVLVLRFRIFDVVSMKGENRVSQTIIVLGVPWLLDRLRNVLSRCPAWSAHCVGQAWSIRSPNEDGQIRM